LSNTLLNLLSIDIKKKMTSCSVYHRVKVKVKVALQQATKAQRGADV